MRHVSLMSVLPSTSTLVSIAMLVCTAVFAGAGEPAVKHPNLLLNQEEIEQVKLRIAQNDWAARLLEKAKALAEQRSLPEAAICYALTGDRHALDS